MEIGWALLNLAQQLFLLAWSAVWIPAALVLRLATGSARLPLSMARRVWAPPLFRAGRVRLEVRGLERVDFRRTHLFAANHQSIFDIAALFVGLPVNLRFVARSSLRRVPFLGWYMAAMGMVFVERSAGRRASGAVQRAGDLLAAGESFVTFPEGTRTFDGSVGEFKAASLAPAIRAGVPVVPVAIDGAFEVLPRGGFRLRPGTIRLTLGQPVETRDLAAADRRALALEIHQRVLALRVEASSPARGVR
jgi:1-acyl-sn-glycerol-3-phosphate acyltransferase